MGAWLGRVMRIRGASPWFDRIMRSGEHYMAVGGNQLSGGVTYYGFLSFFPIVALAFFAVGQVSGFFPEARDNLSEALTSLLPGVFGEAPGQWSLASVEANGVTLGLVGLVGVLVVGLSWLSALRKVLARVFEVPPQEGPGFVWGKVRDLASLISLGVVLLVSVAVSALVSRFSADVAPWLGLGANDRWVLTLLTWVIGLATSAALFLLIFRFLSRPGLRNAELLSGALLGAVGFEALKRISGVLIAWTQNGPAFQVFGISLILLVWINYFSRLVLFSAAWAHTSPSAVQRRVRQEAEEKAQIERALAGTDEPGRRRAERARRQAEKIRVHRRRADRRAFTRGAGAMLALVAVVRRRNRP